MKDTQVLGHPNKIVSVAHYGPECDSVFHRAPGIRTPSCLEISILMARGMRRRNERLICNKRLGNAGSCQTKHLSRNKIRRLTNILIYITDTFCC